MQILRDQALSGEVILWILKITDYDRLNSFFDDDELSMFSALPIDSNRPKQMQRLI